MQRYVSDPLRTPPGAFYRADLEFEAVDHANTSYVAHVHLNQPEADETTGRTPQDGYAGHFSIFAHGECWGDEGHCEIPEPVSPFDRQAPHPLTPIQIGIEVTDALRALAGAPEIRVTVLAFPVGRGQDPAPLKFGRLRLVTYS